MSGIVSRRLVSVIAVGCALAATPAVAATKTISFNLTGIFTAGAPVNPLTGQFSVTFDDASDIAATSNGLTITALNFTPSAPIVYSYEASDGVMIFGDYMVEIGGFFIRYSYNDFGMFYFSRTNSIALLEYTYSNNNLYEAVTATATPTGVPEPASWALMAGGLGLAGAALRRRRAPARSVAAV